MGISYALVKSDVTYPLVDVVVGTEPVIDPKTGQQVFYKEQLYLEDGKPDVEFVLNDEGVIIKQAKFDEVFKVRELKEAQPDLAGVPDGIAYELVAWDSDKEEEKDGVTLSFHIGRAVWENYLPEQRVNVLRKEVEIKYAEAKASWLEGIQVVGDA